MAKKIGLGCGGLLLLFIILGALAGGKGGSTVTQSPSNTAATSASASPTANPSRAEPSAKPTPTLWGVTMPDKDGNVAYMVAFNEADADLALANNHQAGGSLAQSTIIPGGSDLILTKFGFLACTSPNGRYEIHTGMTNASADLANLICQNLGWS